MVTIYLTGPWALERVVVERQGPTDVAVWTGAVGEQRAAAWVYLDTEADADAYVAAWVENGAEADPSWTADEEPYTGPSLRDEQRAERRAMACD